LKEKYDCCGTPHPLFFLPNQTIKGEKPLVNLRYVFVLPIVAFAHQLNFWVLWTFREEGREMGRKRMRGVGRESRKCGRGGGGNGGRGEGNGKGEGKWEGEEVMG
jgi:hypothetical protein